MEECDGGKSFCVCNEINIGCDGMDVYIFDKDSDSINILPTCAIIRFKLSKESDIELVSKDGMLLKYIAKPSLLVCLTAVDNNPKAVWYIKNIRIRRLVKKILYK